ncbi:histidine phosphatase family protein [bacterium]|nr:histidine phosphatase family protein [bacterium]
MNTKFILVRHGETEWNKQGVFRGRKDLALNENGIQQAKALSQWLANEKIDAVFSSPLKRAIQTAEQIASPRNLEVKIEENFNNIELGEWQGEPKTGIKDKYPEEWNLWINDTENWKVKGSETLQDIRDRAIPAVQKLTEEYTGKTVVIVSHRSVLKLLITTLIGIESGGFWNVYLDNASYSILEYDPNSGFVLTLMNQTCYLEDKVIEEF